MTVTVTAMCGANHVAQSGNFIMCADTLISYMSDGVPTSSNPSGSKIYDLPCGFYVAIADDISRSHQIVTYLWNEMKSLTPGQHNMVDSLKHALERAAEWVRLWTRREVLAEYQVSQDEFLHDKKLVGRREIAAEIRDRVISTQITVAGFGHNNCPILMFTDCINIQEQTSPGFFCAGAGMGPALDWLNFRQQNCFLSTQRTFYHVREAWEYSTISPVVGSKVNIILLRPGKPKRDISVLTPVLSEWGSKMFPQKTDALDQKIAWEQFASAYGIND